MKLKEIKDLTFEDIIWTLRFGKPVRKGTIHDLRVDGFKNINRPVFFLSTGRTGTLWFSKLLSLDKHVKVKHKPVPDLAFQGRFVWEMYVKNNFNLPEEKTRSLEEIFLSAREQYLRYSFKTNKRYIETNNYITFFAPVIAGLIPDSIFVHLYRHPGEFARSAIRRNYYQNNNADDIKRIIPVNILPGDRKWEEYSQIEKTAWLWFETNSFIEEFKSNIPTERIYTLDINELNLENVLKLIRFAGISIKISKVEKMLKRKANVQKTGSFKVYNDWGRDQKEELANICGELSDKYGYKLV